MRALSPASACRRRGNREAILAVALEALTESGDISSTPSPGVPASATPPCTATSRPAKT